MQPLATSIAQPSAFHVTILLGLKLNESTEELSLLDETLFTKETLVDKPTSN